jgi:signal transduction histidine kinase
MPSKMTCRQTQVRNLELRMLTEVETQKQRSRYNRHQGMEPTTDLVIVKKHDSGILISDEDHLFIFERFYRADQSRSPEAGGPGLGLSIAMSMADAHHASIHVTSSG